MPQSWGESNQELSQGQRDGCTGVTCWDQWPRRIAIPLNALPEGARISSEMCCGCHWNLQAKLHTTLLPEAPRPDGKLLFCHLSVSTAHYYCCSGPVGRYEAHSPNE